MSSNFGSRQQPENDDITDCKDMDQERDGFGVNVFPISICGVDRVRCSRFGASGVGSLVISCFWLGGCQCAKLGELRTSEGTASSRELSEAFLALAQLQATSSVSSFQPMTISTGKNTYALFCLRIWISNSIHIHIREEFIEHHRSLRDFSLTTYMKTQT